MLPRAGPFVSYADGDPAKKNREAKTAAGSTDFRGKGLLG